MKFFGKKNLQISTWNSWWTPFLDSVSKSGEWFQSLNYTEFSLGMMITSDELSVVFVGTIRSHILFQNGEPKIYQKFRFPTTLIDVFPCVSHYIYTYIYIYILCIIYIYCVYNIIIIYIYCIYIYIVYIYIVYIYICERHYSSSTIGRER